MAVSKKNIIKNDKFINRLAVALVKLKVMSDSESESFIKEFQERSKGRIDDFLIDENVIDREVLLKALQMVYGLATYDVRGHFFNHLVVLLFPKDVLMSKGIIPLDIDDDIMTIVVSNPEDEEVLDLLGNYVPYSVNMLVGIHRDILDAIEEYYDEDVITSDINDQDTDLNDDTDLIS